jgi:peptidoglycan/LPS O-acetylase OafA/YrhL
VRDVATPSAGERAGAAPHSTALDPEIQALRAGAVTLVVLYHAFPALLPGGYIGVDVFFVISGFLITRQLIAEAERTGTISLSRFWARRARRLLPAALLVLTCTALGTFVWVPLGLWRDYMRELAASALYVQNWLLADSAVDYLRSDAAASPMQHFWTLSVEEQFYIALPILLLAPLLADRRGWLPCSRKQGLLAMLFVATVLSFFYSAWHRDYEPRTGYFSSLTRAWEFGAGALLSFPAPRSSTWLPRFGWFTILVTALLFDADVQMPGFAAMLPVSGAIAVLGARNPASAPLRLTRSAAVQFIGGISYSLYLWHWPLLVLAPIARGSPLEGYHKLGLAGLAVGIAWASTRWVEDPIRHGRWPRQPLRPRMVALASTGAMGSVIFMAWGATFHIERREQISLATAEQLREQDPACFGAQARGSAEPCHNPALAGVLVPNADLVGADREERPDCRETRGTELRVCSLGEQAAPVKHLAAIGDSHLSHLIPALEVIANSMRWRIDVATKNGCYWTTTAARGTSEHTAENCGLWKEKLHAKLQASEPYDAILVTHRADYLEPLPAAGEDKYTTLVRGLVESWRTQTARGTRVVALRDNPVARHDTVDCVARHLARADDVCSLPRSKALPKFDGLVYATRALPETRLIDLTDLYCDERTCHVVIGNVVVYRDLDHLTATFSRTLAPYLKAELVRALE